jgi:uncharacterized protein YqgV (UPF0045/DUF77 family)
MKISVEISLYPLTDEYLAAVDQFIKGLYKFAGLRVKTTHLSTAIVGNYDDVFEALKSEIFQTFQSTAQASFVIKILKGDAEAEVNLDGYR